jgi:hypothetical protein
MTITIECKSNAISQRQCFRTSYIESACFTGIHYLNLFIFFHVIKDWQRIKGIWQGWVAVPIISVPIMRDIISRIMLGRCSDWRYYERTTDGRLRDDGQTVTGDGRTVNRFKSTGNHCTGSTVALL